MAQVTVTAQYVADTTAYVRNVRRSIDVTNELARSLPQVEQAQDKVKTSSIALGAALGTLGAQVFARATGAVMRYAQQGIAAAKQYEQTVISIEGIFAGTGMSIEAAAEKTQSYLADLRDFAAKTPFELPQTLDAVKRLLSIGYAADDVKNRLLPTIGDIVSALGQPASSISAVVYAFGQMKSAGRVLSQDLMQIGNALPGFNAKMAIANEMFQGDFGAMTKAMESGALQSEQAIDVIITAMQKFGGASGAMERQSKTLAGVMSTFADTVNNALIDGLMPSLPVLSETLNEVMPAVEGVATAFAQALGPALIQGAAVMGELAPTAAALIPPIIDLASQFTVLSQVVIAFAPAIQVAADLLGLIADALSMLPAPVFAAIGALLIMQRVAQKTGLTAALSARQITISWAAVGRTMKLAAGGVLVSLTNMRVGMELARLSAARFAAGFKAAMVAAGLAVKGFLLSIGPVGWAIMAIGAAFEIFASQSGAAKARIDEMSSSLDELTGKLNEAGQQSLMKTLMGEISTDDWKVLDQFGLGLNAAMAAIQGGEQAMNSYIDKVNENSTALQGMGVNAHAVANNIWDWGTAVQHATEQAEFAAQAEQNAAWAAWSASDAYKDAAKSAYSAADAYKGMTSTSQAFSDASVEQYAQTKSLEVATAALTAAYNGAKAAHQQLNAVIAEEASFDAAAAATDKLGESLKKNVDYTKNNTKAQREGRAAIRDQVQAYVEYANATKDPVEQQRRLEEGQRKLRKALKEKGIDAKDIDVFKAFKEANKETGLLADEWEKAAKIATKNGNDTGLNFINGVIKALEDNKGKVTTAAAALGQAVDDGFNSPQGQDASSPSKKALASAGFFIDGIVKGITSGSRSVYDAVATLGDNITKIVGNLPVEKSFIERIFNEKQLEKFNKENEKTLIDLSKLIGLLEQAAEAGRALQAATVSSAEKSFGAGLFAELKSIPGMENVQEFMSPIQQAFGEMGDFGSAIDQFDQLDAAIQQYYRSILQVPGISKKVAKSTRQAMREARNSLRQGAEEALRLMAERANIQKQMADREEAYALQVAAINSRYDKLEKDATASVEAIESRWDGIIPGLESALSAANEAFDRENRVLENLISERDGFLDRIGSGLRSFANDLSGIAKRTVRVTQELGNGLTITTETEVADASSFRSNLEARLQSIRDFTNNIRTLLARGLDPTLVQDFVAAGVGSAGETVAALAGAADSEIGAINAAQSALNGEIAEFKRTASSQWYDAGIAQQQAVVAPLQAAAAAAQTALDMAKASRESEVNAARQHLENLRTLRENDLAAAEASRKADMDKLLVDLDTKNREIQANADEMNAKFAGMSATLPPLMRTVGIDSMKGLLAGMESKRKDLTDKAESLARAINRAFRETLNISSPSKVMKTIGQQVAEGLIEGMASSEKSVANAASSLANQVVAPIATPSFSGISAAPVTGFGAMTGVGHTVVHNKFEVNVQSLAGDKRQIGREVVEAIKAFERSSGPVYQPASI